MSQPKATRARTAVVGRVGGNGYIVTPDRYAGCWNQSAPLSEDGNTVIVGHSKPEQNALLEWAESFGNSR